MKYAKLINNTMYLAPNPILHGGSYIGNPPAEVYEAEGYKAVRYTDMPEVERGFVAIPGWREDEDEIVQTWKIVEADVDPAEALEILLGGGANEA